MKGYVYILQDLNDKFYIGSTDNPGRRMSQHRHGYTQTTARMSDPKPVLIQEYYSLEEAREIERRIKNLKRKDYIVKMVKEGRIKLR